MKPLLVIGKASSLTLGVGTKGLEPTLNGWRPGRDIFSCY
jgi:hypothetical protein